MPLYQVLLAFIYNFIFTHTNIFIYPYQFYYYCNYYLILYLIFIKNRQILEISVFAVFYRQQTICQKNKKALKSILVRRYFDRFQTFFESIDITAFFSILYINL